VTWRWHANDKSRLGCALIMLAYFVLDVLIIYGMIYLWRRLT
jgi:hypothetical protein